MYSPYLAISLTMGQRTNLIREILNQCVTLLWPWTVDLAVLQECKRYGITCQPVVQLCNDVIRRFLSMLAHLLSSEVHKEHMKWRGYSAMQWISGSWCPIKANESRSKTVENSHLGTMLWFWKGGHQYRSILALGLLRTKRALHLKKKLSLALDLLRTKRALHT